MKILGNGELTKKLKISAHRFSASALEKIQKSGGEANVLPAPRALEKGVAKVKAEKPAATKKPAKSAKK